MFLSYHKFSKYFKRKYVLLSVCVLILLALVVIPYLNTRNNRIFIDEELMMPNRSCIFCDIANGKMPETKLEIETDEYVIFKDIKPASTHHYLAVPKIHYDSLKALNSSHDGLVERMEAGLKAFFVKKGININDALFGFHLPPFITVQHLHMHGISPRSQISLIYKMVFMPGTAWFKTTEEARRYIKKNEL